MKLQKKIIEKEETPGEDLLFAVYELPGEDGKEKTYQIEIKKDLDQVTTVGSFMALLTAIAANDKLMKSFEKAVRLFSDKKGIVEKAPASQEGMLS